jgi:predicted Zn-dependent peptidase
MSSRLFIRIREKMGAAYYVATDSSANPDTGYLAVRAGVDSKKIEKVISAILQELKKISREKVSSKELKKAKDCIKGKTTLLLEASDAQASFYTAQELLEKKILTLKQIFNRIDKVSSADILETAKDIFRTEQLNLAIIGPFKDKKKFNKLLKF